MTEKQQQVVQMAKDICRVKLNCNDVCNPISACDALKYAERAVEAGYSKQSEGHWISKEEAEQMDRFDLAYTCSVCGHCDWDCTESENFNYCPNCGAKMKGGNDMEETKNFNCDNGRSYRFPAQHCLFCDNCTHVVYDYTHGPYLWLCDLGEEDFRTCGKFKEEVE